MIACQCGCGLPAPVSDENDATRGYVKGHPKRYRKGHRASAQKYKVARSGAGVKALHIIIAERALGRQMPRLAEVHHVDGNTRNNAPWNLVICEDHSYHRLLHSRSRVVRAGGNPNTDLVCEKCGVAKHRDAFASCRRQASGRQTRCRVCSSVTSRARREAARA